MTLIGHLIEAKRAITRAKRLAARRREHYAKDDCEYIRENVEVLIRCLREDVFKEDRKKGRSLPWR